MATEKLLNGFKDKKNDINYKFIPIQASENELGGIKAVDKTSNMTQEVGIDPDTGKLYVDAANPIRDGTLVSVNADFAEVREWADGNPDNEDRIGYFVCVENTSAGIIMRKATLEDDVRGVTMAAPGFSGNASDDKYGSDGKLLPKYDYVAIIGIATVIDNGKCVVKGRCIPTTDGTAIPSDNGTGYQVIERIDPTHIKIVVEPGTDTFYRIKNSINDTMELEDRISTNENDIDSLRNRVLENATNITALQLDSGTSESVNMNLAKEITQLKTNDEEQADTISELDSKLSSLTKSIDYKIDGAYADKEGYLYLTSNNEVVVGPIGPFAGGVGGTGTGGATNNASMTVTNTSGWLSKTISNTSSCNLNFNWESVENGLPTGPGTLTIKVNGSIKASRNIEQGDNSLDITSYLIEGSNAVRLTINDAYSNSRTIAFNIDVIALELKSTFDASEQYTTNINFAYTAVGSVSKIVYFMFDDELLGTTEIKTSGRQSSYIIPYSSHGAHKLEVYFIASINDSEVESNHLVYDIIFIDDEAEETIISSAFNTEEVMQYSTIVIPYMVYTPGSLTSEVNLYANNKLINTITVDRTPQQWSYKTKESGLQRLSIESNGFEKSIRFNVNPVDIDVQAEVNDLELYLTSNGRSNGEADPNTWIYNDISCEFTGFNNVNNGWIVDKDGITVLRLSGDARLSIPFKPFATDFRSTGKTIEFDFRASEIMNYNTNIISCMSGNKGFEFTPQKATLKSQNTEIEIQYKEDEHTRVSFVVEKRNENRLIYTYINGIISGITQYDMTDDFQQILPVEIVMGSNDVTLDIFNIRIYNNSLTRYQMLDNYIADIPDGERMVEVYNHNDIYNDYGSIVIDKLPPDLPYMVLEGEVLPQYKGDKRSVNGYYVDPLYPENSFKFQNASANVQGTSSQYYARKNYKIKFKNFTLDSGETLSKYALTENAIPTNTFTFKADVASSEGANNVELVRLYNDISPYKTKPQKQNSNIRQGIDGFPIVIFWDNGTEVTFLGKYNFNNDKGTAEVYGFKEGDESWEVLDNTLAITQFKTNDWSGWKTTDPATGETKYVAYEPRYPEDSENIDRFKILGDWIYSTDSTTATNANLDAPVTYNGIEYTVDSAEYRLAKFKNEAHNWFDIDDLLFYYVFTETFLMIDSRVKNSFPTKFGEDKWCWLPYDMDTALGINNEGLLVFDYALEDIDHLESGADVYNGQESVLWNNVRQCFPAEIQSMYRTLRSNSQFNYEAVEKRFEDHQSKWSEAIFNEDAFFKYIQPLLEDNNGAYLGMCQGSKESQRKWWLYNRFKYLDSKYNTGESASNYINFRAYANGAFDIIPYANIYIRIKAGSVETSVRASNNTPYHIELDREDANDTEVMIFSADQLSSVGDLSVFKPGFCNIGSAIKLQELLIGSDTINGNFTDISLGNNRLLKKLDVRNCPNLKKVVDVSGCTNLEEIYFEGSGITGVNLANGGMVKVLHLPNTITMLSLCNLNDLSDFTVTDDDFSNIQSLRIENCSDAVDVEYILDHTPAYAKIRIIGFNKSFDTMEDVYTFYDKLDTFSGLSESDLNMDKAQISGEIFIDTISGSDYAMLKNRYQYIDIKYNRISSVISFYSEDGKTLLGTRSSVDGQPVSFDDPTKESTDQYTYTFAGWANKVNGIIQPNALTKINGDKNLYAIFTANIRHYTATYYNGIINLGSASVPYGGAVADYYRETLPVYNGDEPDNYGDFTGWSPAIITEDTATYAQFEYIGSLTIQYLHNKTTKLEDLPEITSIGKYAFKDCASLTLVDLPNATIIDDYGFNNCPNLVSINTPKATSIGGNAFNNCISLTSVSFEKATSVGSYAFSACTSLTSVDLASVTSIGNGAFNNCTALETIIIRTTSKVCSLTNTNAIPAQVYVYVPQALLEGYKSATNWSTMVDRIRAIEDYPDICGGE